MFTAEQIKENRRKWVEALRSGKYEQGREALRDKNNRFCCLGVLVDVAGCSWSAPGESHYYSTDEGRWGAAPSTACALVALRNSRAEYGAYSLVDANDDGKSFAQIADIIESEPAGLFLPLPA